MRRWMQHRLELSDPRSSQRLRKLLGHHDPEEFDDDESEHEIDDVMALNMQAGKRRKLFESIQDLRLYVLDYEAQQ